MITSAFAVVLPDEPIAVRLLNTIWADRDGVHDAITTSRDLRAWLAATCPDVRSTGADLERFRGLRDALRRLAARVTGSTRGSATPSTLDVRRAVAVVNEFAGLAPSWPRLVLRGGELRRVMAVPSTPGDRLLTMFAGAGVELLTGPSVADLWTCDAPGCVLYFVRDHPRRQWCSTACGNRVRVARHYERHRRQPTGS